MENESVFDGQTSLLVQHDRKLDDTVEAVDAFSVHLSLVTNSVNVMDSTLVSSTFADSQHSQVSYYAHHFYSLVGYISALGQKVVTSAFFPFAELSQVIKYGMNVLCL